MADLYTLGASRVTDASGANILPVVKVLLDVDEEEGVSENYGEVPLMPCLGVTALPAAPDSNGKAEGLGIENAGGFTTVIAGARDSRCTDVVGKLKPGETAVHNTGGTASTRARTFYKENCVATIVGNDMVFMLDRKNQKAQLAAFGHMIQMSPTDGIVMTASQNGTALNGIQLLPDGKVIIWGTQVCLGGHNVPATPATAVIMGPSGITGIPATNVFITPG